MLSNKVILVCGGANARSIAWNVAKVLEWDCFDDERFNKEGAKVVVTYQKPEFSAKVNSLIEKDGLDVGVLR